MTTQSPPSALLPLNTEQLARIQAATTDLSPTQLAWVSGYFWGVLNQHPGAVATAPAPAAEVPSITLLSASQTGNARRVAEALRGTGFAVTLHCGGGGFKSQMKRADASGAPFAVVIGEDEAAAGEVSLKPLRDGGEQIRVHMDALPETLADRLLESEEDDGSI